MPSSYVFTSVDPADSAANGNSEQLNAGSSNDSAEDIFRKHFNPGIESYEPGWNALIGAISAGDEINFDNGRKAINQLWIHSSSGIYLDRRAADVGVIRPSSVGIGDDVFQRLTIKITTKKVVTQALLEAMEVYYGTDSTRANLTSIDGPYDLEDGWELLVGIDSGETITIPFVVEDFTNINAATAKEVAAVISRWLRSNDTQAYALEITNPNTALSAVRIYSGALGLGSAVQVRGGRAQNIFRYPTLLTQVQVAQNWAVRNSVSHSSEIDPGTVRFLVTGASATDLNQVAIGDYVNIFGAGFNTANQGTYTITNIDVRYVSGVLNQFFEVEFDGSMAQASVAMATVDDILFFQAQKTTVNDNGARAVIVAQDSPGEVNVQLPATTIAVSRTALSGAYANLNTALSISTLTREGANTYDSTRNANVVVTTPIAHGLSVGSQVFLDGIVPGNSVAPIVATNGTSTTNASLNSVLTTLADPPTGAAAALQSAVLTSTGDVFSSGGATVTLGVAGPPTASAQRLRILASSAAIQPDSSVRYTYNWIPTADMPAAMALHMLAPMIDSANAGNVLSAGGYDGVNNLAESYVYRAGSNTWGAAFLMAEERIYHSLVTLNDGRILAIGGQNNSGTYLYSCELCIPQAAAPYGTWEFTGSMALDRAEASAVKLSNGKVLICGGRNDTVRTEKCELYDPSTGTWSVTGSMGYGRAGHTALLLPNDQVFIWGGIGYIPSFSGAGSTPLNTAEIYDGRTGRWYPVSSNLHRTAPAESYPDQAVYMPTLNQVLLFGRMLDRIDIFDVETHTWRQSPPVANLTNDGTWYNALTALSDSPIVVSTGGGNNVLTGTLGATVFVAASDQVSGGGLNGRMLQVISVPDATTFKVATPDFSGYLTNVATDAEVAPCFQAPAALEEPGPYLYNPTGGFAITGTKTLTTAAIASGTQYRSIGVTPGTASDFADAAGWVVFGFGTDEEFGPVKYVGRSDADTLIIDYGTQFPQDLPVGTTLTLLKDKNPFVPDNPVAAGSMYITDSSSGRVAASNTLDALVAAGISLVKTVVYPGDVGLGAAGFPAAGSKVSDKIEVWAGNGIDEEMATARGE